MMYPMLQVKAFEIQSPGPRAALIKNNEAAAKLTIANGGTFT